MGRSLILCFSSLADCSLYLLPLRCSAAWRECAKRVGSWRCVLHCICCGNALKTNITTLGPLVLPFFEQFMFFVTLVRKKILKAKVKPYIPNFKLAFEHFCIHADGRAVLDELQKNLRLSSWHMETPQG
ncbi:hypothetical protein FH972_008804 [Carpinus fangiana]|uniref:FAE domain-containing protein n=1 Tax=Carpinus fangiana TaxID=176857 RepID=A0A5N6R226_9ROSI|nr:hypothetical protein FH972_008804 [Carpinus fangiana]